jgi:hypothetical protein
MARVVFNQPIDSLLALGPTLQLRISVPGRFELLVANALIDTGGDRCCITKEFFGRLGIPYPETTVALAEAGREPIDAGLIKDLRITFPKCRGIDLPFAILPTLGGPHDVLIGRQLFIDGLITVDFKHGRFVLHMPRVPDEEGNLG